MGDKQLRNFISWAKEKSFRRGLVCHFYMPESEKQYYDKTDFAYLNLFSDSTNWIIKGTPNHGIRSRRHKWSPVPCLNCFQVDEEFHSAMKTLVDKRSKRFDVGIVLYKRKLKNKFNVIDVSIERPNPLPPPNKCHYFDNASSRRGVLFPFNYCKVVRIEVPRSDFRQIPMACISGKCVAGLIVKHGDYWNVSRLLKQKGMNRVEIFPIL
jgi:hypothetical protein